MSLSYEDRENMTPNQIAVARFTAYFSALVESQPDRERWKTGLKLARQWAILLEEARPDMKAINSLFAELESVKGQGSGLYDLYLHVNGWRRYLLARQNRDDDKDATQLEP